MRSDKDFTPVCAAEEKCRICGESAQRKVEEYIFDDDPMPIRHEYTAYVCLGHFNLIMGIGHPAPTDKDALIAELVEALTRHHVLAIRDHDGVSYFYNVELHNKTDKALADAAKMGYGKE